MNIDPQLLNGLRDAVKKYEASLGHVEFEVPQSTNCWGCGFTCVGCCVGSCLGSCYVTCTYSCVGSCVGSCMGSCYWLAYFR